MRKFLLSLVLVALAGFASAQSLEFEEVHDYVPTGVILQPGTYDIVGGATEWGEMVFEMNVVADTDVSITCVREVSFITEGTNGNNFCFGTCFPDETSETDMSLTAGMPVLFSAHFKAYSGLDENYMPIMIPGAELKVTYTFTIRGGEEYVFNMNFKYSPDAVEENYSALFSNAYPNPASNFVNFDCEMQNATIAIYNMMGQEVIRQDVNDTHVSVNVSDLTDGIYFYSIIVNGDAVKTSKLVVRK